MDLAGSATGTLYGKGTYFADSITKADEYAKEDEEGLCCVLVCRVAGGRVLFNSEECPDGAQLQECVLSGAADSVLGSRDVTKNTFREFVTFDVDQVYVEYVLFYRRIFHHRRSSGTSDTPASVGTSLSARSIEFDGFGVVGLDPVDKPDASVTHSCHFSMHDAPHTPGTMPDVRTKLHEVSERGHEKSSYPESKEDGTRLSEVGAVEIPPTLLPVLLPRPPDSLPDHGRLSSSKAKTDIVQELSDKFTYRSISCSDGLTATPASGFSSAYSF